MIALLRRILKPQPHLRAIDGGKAKVSPEEEADAQLKRLVEELGLEGALRRSAQNEVDRLKLVRDETKKEIDQLSRDNAQLARERDRFQVGLLALNVCPSVPRGCALERPCKECVETLHRLIQFAQEVARA